MSALATGVSSATEGLTGVDQYHRDADAQIARGGSLQGSTDIGGVPDYTALIQGINDIKKQQVNLPVDMQVAINNATQAQLGANQAQKQIHGGDVTKAAMGLSSDAMANAAIHSKSAGRFQEAVHNDMDMANGLASDEANKAGQNALANDSAVDMSRLKDAALRAQVTHDQHMKNNAADSMTNDLTTANAQGIEQVKTASQAASNAMDSAVNANNVAAWGQAMAAGRAVGAAGSAGLAAGSSQSTSGYGQSGDPYSANGVSSGGSIDGQGGTGEQEGMTDVTGSSFDNGEGSA